MDRNEYMKQLDIVYNQLPEILKKSERFTIPEARGRFEKNKTLITNFTQIATQLSRSPDHLMRHFLKEVGVRGNTDDTSLVLHSRCEVKLLNNIIKRYCNVYVICSRCHRPDTTLSNNSELTCKACGFVEKVPQL